MWLLLQQEVSAKIRIKYFLKGIYVCKIREYKCSYNLLSRELRFSSNSSVNWSIMCRRWWFKAEIPRSFYIVNDLQKLYSFYGFFQNSRYMILYLSVSHFYYLKTFKDDLVSTYAKFLENFAYLPNGWTQTSVKLNQ